MTSRGKRDLKIRNNPNNVSFGDVGPWLEAHGFVLERVSGSHHIFRHPLTKRKLNFQPDKSGKAKEYQVSQAIKAIDDMEA